MKTVICCTCRKQYPSFGRGCVHAGHFLSGRRNSILFDEKCVHAQCAFCNIQLKGNYQEYEKFMLLKYGVQVVNDLKAKQFSKKRYTIQELKDLIQQYEALIITMRGK